MPSLFLGCSGSAPTDEPTDPRSASGAGFSGTLTCPAGEDAGSATWDYSANPRGETTDPVAWVRGHARGLGASLTLTFLPTAGELEDVVVATRDDGVALAFVTFGEDDEGRYFPNEAEACPSAGIEDFT